MTTNLEKRLSAIEGRIEATPEPFAIRFECADMSAQGAGKPFLGADGTPEQFVTVSGVPVPKGLPRIDGKDFVREPGESVEDFENRIETFRQSLIKKSKQLKPTFKS